VDTEIEIEIERLNAWTYRDREGETESVKFEQNV
jgi:hypothetical protein